MGKFEAVAAVVNQQGAAFEFEAVTVGPIRADEVLVEIVASGICHTDLAVRDQRRAVSLPAILGHEGAGVVREVGRNVSSVSKGDHVVLSYMSCGECRECRTEQSASCSHLGALCFASARVDGSHAVCGHEGRELSDRFFGQSSFSTLAVASARNIVAVPKHIPLEILAPLGCGVMTGAGAVWNALEVEAGGDIAIFGAGGVGLSGVLAARVAGAAIIIAVDRVASRLALAADLGATHLIDASLVDDVPGAIQAITGRGVAYALDTTGVSSVLRDAYTSLGQRGVLAIAATASPAQELVLPQLDLMTSCKSIIGVIEGSGDARCMIPKMIALYEAGRFPFDRLIKTFDFTQINEAVEACETGSVVKAVLIMRSSVTLASGSRAVL